MRDVMVWKIINFLINKVATKAYADFLRVVSLYGTAELEERRIMHDSTMKDIEAL
jgi:hypothetical protein